MKKRYKRVSHNISKMKKIYKSLYEWFKQADYDLKTAQTLFQSGRYIYTVFFCHLSVEKALKGVYAKILKKDPPKVHNLNYLLDQINIKQLPDDIKKMINYLNDISVPSRYPEELSTLIKHYKKQKSEKILNNTKQLLLWLKKK